MLAKLMLGTDGYGHCLMLKSKTEKKLFNQRGQTLAAFREGFNWEGETKAGENGRKVNERRQRCPQCELRIDAFDFITRASDHFTTASCRKEAIKSRKSSRA